MKNTQIPLVASRFWLDLLCPESDKRHLRDRHEASGSTKEFTAWLMAEAQTSALDDDLRFWGQMAIIEAACCQAQETFQYLVPPEDGMVINPTLSLLELDWDFFPTIQALLQNQNVSVKDRPEKHSQRLMVWCSLPEGALRISVASDWKLLVLKLLAEETDLKIVAKDQEIAVGSLDNLIWQAVDAGFVVRTPSQLRRDPAFNISSKVAQPQILQADTFTLQWHITQHCKLHCKHCYDRSKRSTLNLAQIDSVLSRFRHFCQSRHVRGQIHLSGGDPLLYPNFRTFYQTVANYGFLTAILGNPTTSQRLDEILAIQPLQYYQLSLEGLPKHNDAIRGLGHFQQTLEFLELLKQKNIFSKVVLTLTSANIDQVIPLTRMLKDRISQFTFSRLSKTGEGADLELPTSKAYSAFLNSYVDEAQNNPLLSHKDGLTNIILEERALPLCRGCTGFGCGAAFNFIALLADGEVHACRKFPSPLGNILDRDFNEVYDSHSAQSFRGGSHACRDCNLLAVCGGCLAVTAGEGQDFLTVRDPHCFRQTV